tara:strand:+ start:1779 stop:4889 length:3111 start_codon:yes stop_codon:yes gene_type:complete
MKISEYEIKISKFKNIIKKTILAVQKYKSLDIILAGELNSTLEFLNDLFTNIVCLDTYTSKQVDELETQLINLVKNYGTESLEDLIGLILGNNFIEEIKDDDKYDILKNYIHPINCRLISKNSITPNSEEHKLTNLPNLTCLDNIDYNNKFQLLVYGIKIVLINGNNILVINGIIDDVGTMFIDNKFIKSKEKKLINMKIEYEYKPIEYQRYVKSLSLKDMLIYSEDELIGNFIKFLSDVDDINKVCLSNTIENFTNDALFNQRDMLIKLLIKDNAESKYLAYLLYDLLSNENNGVIDTYEQTLLYDSLPWNLRKYFNEAMKQTVQYTNNLNNTANNKLPLEQQICLLKVDDLVKEKAMTKLKEVRNKSEDSGAKAKSFLDGLLKIPFGIYCEENILKTSKNLKKMLYAIIDKNIKLFKLDYELDKSLVKNNYELEILVDKLIKENLYEISDEKLYVFIESIKKRKRPYLIKIVNNINSIIKKEGIKMGKLVQSGKTNKEILLLISDFITNNVDTSKKYFYLIENADFDVLTLEHTLSNVKLIKDDVFLIKNYITNVRKILDDSVYGHTDAKRQIERIIGQWINGTNSGYCFGFEGPPGVGKTSLAKKGLSLCLKDINDKPRPFSFIGIGGSSNGSILEGHSYTYVGSTWGKVVDILIDSKCMNPIIFIDELDKISKTENGKEIIGILTHLIDPTQNDKFQDKYFTGIDLDLSKALFVFSYNDVNLIDRILLDRIHRIKFDFLSLNDKIEIVMKFILPEIYAKMGLENIIDVGSEVIEYIIETYTNEPGVRKLKELLFEILGEININILKKAENYDIPIKITKDDVKGKYLKSHNYIINKKVGSEGRVGVINGLWANSVGSGGILSIEVSMFPSTTLMEFKLTGLQGDVMKESMNVAKTLACNLTEDGILKEYIERTKNLHMQGIHIHCPEGATPKDGPSAGAAICLAIYSLINNKKIRSDVAITGELNLQGEIMAIGGLDLKITGAIKAGVKEILYPKDNSQDYEDFVSKNSSNLENIRFVAIDNIKDVINIIML